MTLFWHETGCAVEGLASKNEGESNRGKGDPVCLGVVKEAKKTREKREEKRREKKERMDSDRGPGTQTGPVNATRQQ